MIIVNEDDFGSLHAHVKHASAFFMHSLCTSPLLRSMLRDVWKSDAIIQSDCCDSVNTMRGQRNPHSGQLVANVTEALGLAVNEGLGAYFGDWQ